MDTRKKKSYELTVVGWFNTVILYDMMIKLFTTID